METLSGLASQRSFRANSADCSVMVGHYLWLSSENSERKTLKVYLQDGSALGDLADHPSDLHFVTSAAIGPFYPIRTHIFLIWIPDYGLWYVFQRPALI